jgi:VWFA-related protein
MLFLWVAVVAAAQQVEPVYRTGTRLVQVDVVVRNDKGPVKGLTKDDFTIQDKGKAQTISVFAMNETRADGAKPTPLPPGVSSNRIGSSGESAQNATVIVFDRLNIAETQSSSTSSTSSSSSSNSSTTGGALSGAQARAGQQVLQLLTSLKVPEKVGLYSLFQDLKVVRDFTDDSQPLMEAAKRATASPQKTGATPAEQALDTKLRDALTPGYPLDRSVRAEVTEKAFRAIARRMAGVPGRKSLIWITSSFPLTYGDDPNHQAESNAEVNGIATLLGDANIALYSIDPRGAGTAFSQSNSATSDDPSGGGKGGKGGGKGMRSLDSSAPTNGLSGVESMQLIAEQTGGKAFINVNDIAPPIREVIDSSEVSYTLGFYVDDKALDGKKHDVSVKVSKKPETSGAKVSFRKSYMATAQREHPQMDELVSDRLDANRIGVMAAAAPAPNRPGIDAVQVRVDVKDLQFEKRADKWFTSFDLALALEAGGEPKISSSPKSLSLSDDQLRQALTGGVTIDNTVPAPDKAATLRVVIQDKATGEAGSVRIPLPGK